VFGSSQSPCDTTDAELGSRASPVLRVASPPVRLSLAVLIAILIVAAAMTFAWVASGPFIALSALAILIVLFTAAATGYLWRQAERARRLSESRFHAARHDESRRAEAKYRALAENIPAVTWLAAPGDRSSVLYLSPQVETMLGYSSAEWRAEPRLFSRLLHPEDRDSVLAELERGESRTGPVRFEYRLVARDGRIVWIRQETSTIRDAAGDPLFTQTLLLDVTERKQAAAERERLRTAEREADALKAVRERRLDFLRNAGGTLGATVDTRASIQRVTELTVRELADWCTVDAVAEDGALTRLGAARSEPRNGEPGREPDGAVKAVVDSGRRLVLPPLAQPDDGDDNRYAAQLHPDLASLVCVPIESRGRPLGALTLVRSKPGRCYDADELALAEDLASRVGVALDRARLYHEVEERADASRVLTYVADAILLLDRTDHVRLWNPAAERITGIPAAEVLGRDAADAIPGWREAVDSIPVSTSPDPGHPEVMIPIETKQQGERWIAISGVRFFGGTVYAFRDVTEGRQLEELKADFIATASHELRTPLAAVYGAAQTLLRHDFALDEAGRDRFVSLIAEESERLGRIVNEILLANQLDSGRVDLGSEPFDPVELVERVVEAARAHAHQEISVERVVPAHAPFVAADRDKVRQVLVNLIENAIKYSPDGGRIEVGLEEGQSSGDETLIFFVKDEGIGIPTDEQERIFEKFYRLDPQMTRGVGGTGLGLYICSELVHRMGGNIWVDSTEGKGSTFLLELPVEHTPLPRALRAQPQQSRGRPDDTSHQPKE
jgi:PAS domain S-box-containing protein